MKDTRPLVVVLLLGFVIILVLSVDAAVRKQTIRSDFAGNVTGINLTVNVFSCKGEKIDETFLQYLKIELWRGGNQTGNISGVASATFSRLSPGNYSLVILFMGSKVYERNLVLQNSTQLNINANVTKVVFRAVDLSKAHGVKGFTLRVGGLSFNSGSSDTIAVWLPFGATQYSVLYNWLGAGNVSAAGSASVFCDTNFISVSLPVWGTLAVEFRQSDGSPVYGLNGSAEVYYSGVRVGVLDFKTQSSLTLQGALTGPYTVKVYLHGRKIQESTIFVDDKNWSYVVQVQVIRSLRVKLFDKSYQPLVSSGLSALIATPLKETYNFSLSETNVLMIPESVMGDYEIQILSAQLGLLYETRFRVEGEAVDLQLPLVYANIVFKPAGSSVIPRGVSVKVFCVRGESRVLLWATSSLSDGTENIKRVPVGVLPLGVNLEVEVSYAGVKYDEIVNVAASGSAEVEIPVYDVVLRVVDKNGVPLRGCWVNISAASIAASADLQDGLAVFKSLPDTEARVTVTCSSVKVAEYVFKTSLKSVNVSAYVVSLEVSVKGWFDKPLPAALVEVSLISGNKTLFKTSAKTDESGVAVFRSIPAPPDAELVLRVSYGPYTSVRKLKGDEGRVSVFFDVLLDTPFLKLSLFQVIALVIGGAISVTVGLLTYKRYSHVLALKRMFAVGTEEGEEEEGGVLQKLKNILHSRRKEEEEEEGLFF